MKHILPDDIQAFIFCACTHTHIYTHARTYTGPSLLDIMHCTELKPLHMMANSTPIATNPICCEWEFTPLSSMYCS